MSDGCGWVVAEGSETNIAILLHRDMLMTVARRPPPSAGGSHRVAVEGKHRPLRSDHALRVETLQVPDPLGGHPDKRTRDIRASLLGQFALVSHTGRARD